MKCLTDSKVTAVTATAIHVPSDLANAAADLITDATDVQLEVLGDVDLTDPEYPPSNVLDSHPKRMSKVEWSEAEYIITVAGGSSSVVVGNTNANTVEFTVIDGDGNKVHEEIKSLSGIDSYARLILDDGLHVSQTGINYPYQINEHTVRIRFLTGNAAIHAYVGLIQAGVLYRTGRDSSRGLKEGLHDYSIERELSNGAFFYKQRDIVRTFSGSVYLKRDPDFYLFMHSIFRKKGKNPLFWQMTDVDNHNWFVYARAQQLPSGTHKDFSNSTINFALIEVL